MTFTGSGPVTTKSTQAADYPAATDSCTPLVANSYTSYFESSKLSRAETSARAFQVTIENLRSIIGQGGSRRSVEFGATFCSECYVRFCLWCCVVAPVTAPATASITGPTTACVAGPASALATSCFLACTQTCMPYPPASTKA